MHYTVKHGKVCEHVAFLVVHCDFFLQGEEGSDSRTSARTLDSKDTKKLKKDSINRTRVRLSYVYGIFSLSKFLNQILLIRGTLACLKRQVTFHI